MSNLPTENNNPGDLRDVGQIGATQGSGGFASFSSPEAGFGALLNDLQIKTTNHPNETLADFSNTYAPPSDGNDSAHYAASLANQLGVAPDATLGSLQPEMGKFAEAVASNEGYEGSLPNLESSVPTANAASSESGNTSSVGQSNWLSSLEGLGLGGASWLAGKAVQYGAKPLEDAAVDAGIGAIGGPETAGAGAIAGLIQGVIQDFTDGSSSNPSTSTSAPEAPQVSNLPPEENSAQPRIQSNPQAQTQAAQTAYNAITETMQANQTNRNYANSQTGQEIMQTAATHGLVSPDENGNLKFDSDKLKKLEAIIEEGKDGVIASQNSSNSPVAVSNHAGKEIENSRLSTPSDRTAAAKIVSDELTSDRGSTPINGQMSLGRMRELQKAHNQKSKDAFKEGNYTPTPKSLAHKAIAKGYKEAIRDKIRKEDLPLYDKLSETSAKLTRVKDLKKRVEGKAAPKNNKLWKSILKSGARYAEIYIGDKLGGPLGAVLGAMAGEHINHAIDKKYGKTIFETKGMKAAMDILNKTHPETYNKLVEELKKHDVNVPKDEIKKPSTKAGLINLIKKDESKFKGKKGLISPNRSPKTSQ